jgi:hypothetical protein
MIYITGVFIAVGSAESQAQTPDPEPCGLAIEITALRGGSPTVSPTETEADTKDITAKARILKGTAPKGTTIETTLTIEAFDGLDRSDLLNSVSAPGIWLGIGKGGQGKKFTMTIPKCETGTIEFVATFSEGDTRCATRAIQKTCK